MKADRTYSVGAAAEPALPARRERLVLSVALGVYAALLLGCAGVVLALPQFLLPAALLASVFLVAGIVTLAQLVRACRSEAAGEVLEEEGLAESEEPAELPAPPLALEKRPGAPSA